MKRKLSVFCFLLLLLPSSLMAQALKQDDSYTIGKLDNGLTYYIRHNAKEAGLADFYIAQRVGSILEEPRQRGLAHFLEHMAFNGTQNFSGKGSQLGVVPWCESVGVKFGANLNAYTSVDETVYHIGSAPINRAGVLDSALLVLHDWSHYILLEDKEIDKERGVIHEEWRTRRAGKAVERMMEHVLPEVYAGTKYADCLPIGSMDVVDHFPYKDLRDYYQKWYRPDLQAIIVVGDIDVKAVEAKIKSLFGPIPMPANAAKREYFPVTDNDSIIIATDKDTEQPIMLTTLYMKRDATPDNEKNNEAYLREEYVDGLMTSMLNSRLQELQHRAVPPVLSAVSHSGEFFVSRTKDAFTLSFGCRQENIKGSFDAAIGESERARRFGFTANELARAKALQMKAAVKRSAEGENRQNSYYVNRAVNNFLASEPLVTDAERLALVKKWDASVSLDDVNAETKKIISNKNEVLTVYIPDKPGFNMPTKAELKNYIEEAQKADYKPYVEEKLPSTLIAKLPKAGKIMKEKDFGQWGVKEITLSNGVKVYVKSTSFDKDNISMRFWREGGLEKFPDSDEPNYGFVTTSVTSSGIGDFNADQLRKILSGKTVKCEPGVGYETQSISGSSSIKDLKTLMQLTYLYFTSPRHDATAFNGELNRMRSFLTNREANPQVSYNDSITKILYGDSPRMQPTKKESLDKVSYERSLEMYRQLFGDASGFRMLLVGNVNIDSLRPLLNQYIASLPTAKKSDAKSYKSPDIVGENKTHLFYKKMNTPSALVGIFYTFQEPFTPKSDLDMDVLKRVLSIAYTDSVREEKGGVYGVSVQYDVDKTSNPTTILKISFRTDPSRYTELIPIIYKQIENIANKGPEPTSMEKVKTYLLKAYNQNIIDNGYWDYVIYSKLRNNIDYDTDYVKMVKGITSADIQAVANDLLKSGRRIEVTMLSEK
ncbi:MAG: insulinase family protein [Prevotella sp.]|jgi:zinc protease|nr:insulinase family protein [Prevotella sp.]MCI1281987.1 insulinase family protein [Prevotella sp.]